MMKIFLILYLLITTTVCVAQTNTIDRIGLIQENNDKLVQDLAGVFSKEEQTVLSQKLASYRDSTSTAIKVISISSLGGKDIQTLSLEIANAWQGIDPQKKNAILILLASFEQQARIELGKGIVPQISSEEANKILLDVFKPFAEKEEYYEGINMLIDTLTRKLNREYKPSHLPSEGTQSLIFLFSILPIFFTIAFFYEKEYKKGGMGILAFCPWFFGVGYIIYTTPTNNQASWVWQLIGIYILVGIIALVIIFSVEMNKQAKAKAKRLEKERAEMEEGKAVLVKKIAGLLVEYKAYMDEATVAEWEKKEYLKLHQYTKINFYYKKHLKELEAREKALLDLNGLNDFFEKNNEQLLTDFYPQKLIHTYWIKLQKYLLEIYMPPSIPRNKDLSNYVLNCIQAYKLPFFDKLILAEDIDETEIKNWLEQLSNTKRLNTYKHYPIQLQDKKAVKNEKKLLARRNKEMLAAKGAKETYQVLVKVIEGWLMHDYVNELLGKYAKEVKKKQNNSNKTNPLNTYKKNNKDPFWDGDGFDDNDYGNDEDIFDGDGADISW